jgi:hypothetical protein
LRQRPYSAAAAAAAAAGGGDIGASSSACVRGLPVRLKPLLPAYCRAVHAMP